MKYIIFIVLYFSTSYHLFSQETWLGYGTGLAYFEILEDKIEVFNYYQNSASKYEYITWKSGDMTLYKNKKAPDEFEPKTSAKFLNTGKDSLLLKINDLKF